MVAVRTEGLTKRYKDTVAVDGLSLEINEGELFALLGVNGAGKTTTVKMLSCLTAPDGGDAFVLSDSVVRSPSAVKSSIGVSPQETAVASGLSVRENLELICGIYSFTAEKTKKRVDELSSMLGLSGVMNKKAGKLSGGYARRLSIAMALISEPRVLFLDEPTLGLDVIARSELWDIIRSLRGRVTTILTTHYMEEAEALCDRIAVMKDGRLLVCDTPSALKSMTGEDSVERAFISIVRGTEK